MKLFSKLEDARRHKLTEADAKGRGHQPLGMAQKSVRMLPNIRRMPRY
jgi:hypothetical protein